MKLFANTRPTGGIREGAVLNMAAQRRVGGHVMSVSGKTRYIYIYIMENAWKYSTFCRMCFVYWTLGDVRMSNMFRISNIFFAKNTHTHPAMPPPPPPGNKDLTRPWLGMIQVQTEQPFSVALCQFARPPASWNVQCWSSWLLGLKQEAIRGRKQWFYPSKLGRKGEAWWNLWTSSGGWEKLEAFLLVGWLMCYDY